MHGCRFGASIGLDPSGRRSGLNAGRWELCGVGSISFGRPIGSTGRPNLSLRTPPETIAPRECWRPGVGELLGDPGAWWSACGAALGGALVVRAGACWLGCQLRRVLVILFLSTQFSEVFARPECGRVWGSPWGRTGE
jgi:hypothetical protein